MLVPETMSLNRTTLEFKLKLAAGVGGGIALLIVLH